MVSAFQQPIWQLCVVASLAYVANSLAACDDGSQVAYFRRCYLNDLLLVPVALPPLLLASSCLGLRSAVSAPTLVETAAVVVTWSIAFELVGPHVFGRGTSDPLDVVAYGLGGLITWAFLRRRYSLGLRKPACETV